MMDNLDIQVDRHPYGRHLDLYMFNKTHVVTALTIKEYNQDCVINPVSTISTEVAQVLMDSLWRSGIRPTEAQVGDALISSKDKHLEDMRALLCHSTGAKLKGVNGD